MGSDGFREVRNGVRGFVCVISGCTGLSSSDAWLRGSVGIFVTSIGFGRFFCKPLPFHKSISQLGGHFAAKEGFRSKMGILQLISQLRNGTRVLGSGFTTAKIFVGGVLWLRNDFEEGGLFRSETSISQRGAVGCKMVS